MSYVTGVTLLVGCCEDEEEIRDKLNSWLNRGTEADYEVCFYELSEGYGGSKFPQQFVFGAGVNYCDKKELVKMLSSMSWADPHSVILVTKTEDNPVEIWRPKVD